MNSPVMNGRRRQAVRNDEAILDAARAVFLSDPSAPMSQVGARAGVGMSALYRRYAGKEDLLRALAADALQRYRDELRRALAEMATNPNASSAWSAYSTCLERVVAGGSQALAQRLAGSFRPTPELSALAAAVSADATRVHARAQRAGALRRDVSAADVTLLLEAVMGIAVPGERLRSRYLALLLQALRAPAAGDLPGRPAGARELAARWRDAAHSRS